MNGSKRFILYQLPALLWALAIFIESSMSTLAPPPLGIKMEDKILHALVFGVLAFLITRALKYSSIIAIKKHAILLSAILCTVYGLSDEFHQYFVPGRTVELGDFLADFIGVIVVQSVYYIRDYPAYRQISNRKLPENQ